MWPAVAWAVALLLLALAPADAWAAPALTHQGQIIGYSVQGRALQAYTVGWGNRPVVFVGAIHGGSE